MADVQITDLISEGVFASRPAAADAVEYYATDTKVRYYSDGATWTAQPPTVETHVHSGADITSGTVVDARIDAAISRDSELATHTGNATAHGSFAAASHSHVAGDLPDLDSLTGPSADVDINTHKLINVVDPTSNQHAATKKYVDDAIAVIVAGASLLAVQRYAPGGDGSWTRTAATLADVDATNAAITFTAPASGNVLLRVSFFYNISHANRVGMVGLRVASSDVAGPYQVAYNATTIGYDMIAMEFYLTGLTPTTSYTYKLSFAGDATATITIYYGPVTGGSNQPFVMTAWSAP